MSVSLQYSIYKGVKGSYGAVQFRLQSPHYFCPKCKHRAYNSDTLSPKCPNKECEGSDLKTREGALFMEITSAKGPNDYDWDNKIIMALSTQDMGKILSLLEGGQVGSELKLIHDPAMKSVNQGKSQKRLNISSPKGVREGVLLSASYQQKDTSGQPTFHTVPLSGDEAKTLAVLIRYAIPKTLGW